MFHVSAPNHKPTAINDTMMLRFHIAILKIKKYTVRATNVANLIGWNDLHTENDDEGGE
jgi:hypothetical protein